MTDPTVQSGRDDETSSLEHRFRTGNDGAVLDEVIERYLPAIWRLVGRLLVWDHEIEDVVQEVFMKAFIHRKRYRQQAEMKTWLFSIAMNTCRKHSRRQFLRRQFLKQRTACDPVLPDDAAQHTLQREKTALVRKAAQQLAPKYRDAIVLKYMEELPTGQILAILNISEQAFYTRLNRGRSQLQKLLACYMED